jgi:murein DD-endopeptidase MepM/ murein hydrolase activator NlpD
MKIIKISLLLIITFSYLALGNTLPVFASYRMPFADNYNLQFVQTWHAYSSYYIAGTGTYSWTTGPNYAVDIAASNTTDVISPENGIVKYIQTCGVSTNLVIEFNGYEMQFYHLDKNDIYVNIGSNVSKSQLIGKLKVGGFNDLPCGTSQGTHLHLRFETKQGNSDPEKILISGYYFDQYDAGASSCIMHRVENGNNVTYCWSGGVIPGAKVNFTANEQNIDIVISNQTINSGTTIAAKHSITVLPITTLNPSQVEAIVLKLEP